MGRCVNCSISLVNPIRSQKIGEAADDMLNILRSWIQPATLSADAFLCHECYDILRKASVTGSTVRAYGHRKVCFVCDASILRSRTHKVPSNSPEAIVIISSIPIQQIHRLEKVCLRCWTRTHRSVKQQISHEHNRFTTQKTTFGEGSSAIPTPPPLPRLQLHPNQPINVTSKIISQVYKRASASSNCCIFNKCQHTERLLVPSVVKEMLLLEYKLYVPVSARICNYHLSNRQWSELKCLHNDFTGKQMDDMMFIMDRASHRQLDFTNIDLMNPHICRYWLGIDPEQFSQLLSCIPTLAEEVPCPSLALSILLVKHKTGDTNTRLSTLFNIPRTTLERYMGKAKKCFGTAEETRLNDVADINLRSIFEQLTPKS